MDAHPRGDRVLPSAGPLTSPGATAVSAAAARLPQDSLHRSPRLIVLVVLVAWFAWAVIIPWSLTAPPTALFSMIYVVVLAGYGAALFWVLLATVTPGLTGRAQWLRSAQLVAAALVLWAPAHR